VKYTGEFVSRWLPSARLGLPLLLLFGIWSFFFRRWAAPKAA
jgi:hypothetical protein